MRGRQLRRRLYGPTNGTQQSKENAWNINYQNTEFDRHTWCTFVYSAVFRKMYILVFSSSFGHTNKIIHTNHWGIFRLFVLGFWGDDDILFKVIYPLEVCVCTASQTDRQYENQEGDGRRNSVLLLLENWSLRLLMMFDYEIKMYCKWCTEESDISDWVQCHCFKVKWNRRMELFYFVWF